MQPHNNRVQSQERLKNKLEINQQPWPNFVKDTHSYLIYRSRRSMAVSFKHCSRLCLKTTSPEHNQSCSVLSFSRKLDRKGVRGEKTRIWVLEHFRFGFHWLQWGDCRHVVLCGNQPVIRWAAGAAFVQGPDGEDLNVTKINQGIYSIWKNTGSLKSISWLHVFVWMAHD